MPPYADDTAIIVVIKDSVVKTILLQSSLLEIENGKRNCEYNLMKLSQHNTSRSQNATGQYRLRD